MSTDYNPAYVLAMGRFVKVTSIFTTADEANTYMETHQDEGVISESHGFVMLAKMDDEGTPK